MLQTKIIEKKHISPIHLFWQHECPILHMLYLDLVLYFYCQSKNWTSFLFKRSLKGHTDVSMFLSSTYAKSLVCKQFTHSDISSFLKWSNTSVDVTPTTRPWISTKQGSGARMSLAYCFRSTNGGTGYTESWWASCHEGTISTCVLSLKKQKITTIWLADILEELERWHC